LKAQEHVISVKSNTANFIRRLGRLFVPIISDTLDEMGITENTFSPEIRPIFPNLRMAGTAFTARTQRYKKFTKAELADWLRIMIRMLEASGPGDVFVVSTGSTVHAASWGELMSNAAQARGARGAVTDGAVRDVPRILSMPTPFSVYAKAFNPADAKGRLKYVDYEVPVECGGVKVHPGDLMLGDLDGIVCIPRREVSTVIKRAEEKLVKEDGFRRAVRRGVSVSEAFAKYRTF
jgi:4-hydroxy-4-methyl-2-oxoglutarate aldolase